MAATATATGPAHVAIVGCGFTGTTALHQLVQRCPVRRITVFEAGGRFGPGYPYRASECPDYLINNTTDTMCLLPDNRQAFIQWLRARHPGVEVEAKGHLPRAVYGEFLADTVQTTLALAAQRGIAVQTVCAEVTALHEPAAGGVVVRWAGGELQADAVILATGRCPDHDPIGPPPTGSSARYFASHIDNPTLDELPLDASCHVLGASLSACDIVNRLFSPATGCRFEPDPKAAHAGELRFVPGPNQRRVVLCSRSGRLKKMQSRRPMAIRRRHLTDAVLQPLAARGALTLAALAGLIDDEARAHQVTLDWLALREPYAGCHSADAVTERAAELLAQDIAAAEHGANFLVDLAGDAQMLLWDQFAAHPLSPDEERRYRRTLESTVLCFTAPCPVPTAQRLLALMRAGRLQLRHGVQGVRWSGADQAWRIACAFGDETARVLINASGSMDRRVDSPDQPALVRSLHQQGLLRPYTCGGVPADGAAVDMARFCAQGSRAVFVAGMWLWGPGLFTSSAYMMANVVRRLLDGLYPPA